MKAGRLNIMNIKLKVASVLLGTAGTGAAFAWQEHSHEHQAGKPAQITGQVVDIACFMGHDTSGPKHAKCAEACARAGNPLAIYDEASKTLYLPVSLDHKNPNAKLMEFIEKKVKVSGRVMEKDGIKGIAIEKVEAAQ
jgi:hypothetical protein